MNSSVPEHTALASQQELSIGAGFVLAHPGLLLRKLKTTKLPPAQGMPVTARLPGPYGGNEDHFREL